MAMSHWIASKHAASMPESAQFLEELSDLEVRIMPSGTQRMEVPNTAEIQHRAHMAIAVALAL